MSARRRESIDAFAASGCGDAFHHPSDLRGDGLRVPSHTNAAAVVRDNEELCVETLNHLIATERVKTRVHPVRIVNLGVYADTNTYTVSATGIHPHTKPQFKKHASSGDADLTIKLRMEAALKKLHERSVTAIPLYVTIAQLKCMKWVRETGPVTPEEQLSEAEYPDVYAAVRAAKRANHVMLPHPPKRVPKFGMRAWIRVNGAVYQPDLGNYKHAVAVILSGRTATVIDSNAARPGVVEGALAHLFDAFGFTVAYPKLPLVNQSDTQLKAALAKLGVATTVEIQGYCASLSLAYIVDVMCTGKHTRDHVMRLYEDLGFPEPLGIVLYARTIAADLVNHCLDYFPTADMRRIHARTTLRM